MLPTITDIVRGSVEDAVNLLASLKEAQGRPGVLDDYTVNRAKEQTNESKDFIWIFSEQLYRWREAGAAARLEHELNQLEVLLQSWSLKVEELLTLLDELGKQTIESVLSKSDFELGLEAMLNIFSE